MFGLIEPNAGVGADSPWWKMVGSALAHVVVIAAVAQTAWWLSKTTPPSGTKEGLQVMLLSAPGRPALAAEKPVQVARRPKSPPKVVELPTLNAPSEVEMSSAPLSKRPDDLEGNDALGRGTMIISFVQPFPAQRPDWSKLAAGAPGDMVLDLLIDDNGKVAEARAKKTVGYGIDEVVIATVEQWVFYPATKDGKPVESEQELHFHYDRSHAAAGCGWECFQLAER